MKKPATFSLLAVVSFAAVNSVALPARADVVITRSSDYGFFANFDSLTECPGEPGKTRYVYAFLGFQENATTLAGATAPIAALNLSYSSDCAGGVTALPFSGSAVSDPSEYSFPWNFNQSYTLDKRLGRLGLAFSSYKATFPLYVDSHGCYMQANVDIRMDEQGPQDPIRNFSRSIDGGTMTIDFFNTVIRPALASGTITLSPMAGETCNVSGLPSTLNFAAYPVVFSPYDGTPFSFNYKSSSATITRQRP